MKKLIICQSFIFSLAFAASLGLLALPSAAAAQEQSKKVEAIAAPQIPDELQVAPANDNFVNAETISTSSGNVTANSADATKEAGEPNHAGAIGGRSVWYKWTATNPNSIAMTFTLRNSTTNFDTVLAVYTGSSVGALTQIASSDDYGSTPTTATSTVFVPTVPGTTYYIAIDGFGAASGNFRLTWDVNRIHARSSRFAGTSGSIVSIFRPSNGVWYVNSDNGFQAKPFGMNGDVPVPADYDGDTLTDYAVFRPSNGVWYITLSSNNSVVSVGFGLSGDVPIPGDYNGDGYDDLAVFRPSNGTWYLRSGATSYGTVQFGQSGDKPVARDYDGDGKLDIAVFRPSNGYWYILNSFNGTVRSQPWGTNGDIPVPGEYAVDGKADIAVWRPSNGTWYVLYSFNNQPFIYQWGRSGDIPQPIDYGTNRGVSDLGIYRPSNGTWYIQEYTGGGQTYVQQFGTSGDVPTATLYPVQP